MGDLYYGPEELKARAMDYFFQFSQKNLETIADLLDENVFLEDWENRAYNRAEVIGVYQRIFDSVDNISVTPMKILVDNDIVIGQIMITINGEERIFVVDMIHYNTVTGKIKGIQAYKG